MAVSTKRHVELMPWVAFWGRVGRKEYHVLVHEHVHLVVPLDRGVQPDDVGLHEDPRYRVKAQGRVCG